MKIASASNIEDGIKSLKAFENKMTSNGFKSPEFKMVLTSHGACYRTEDNILVVPINMLRD